MPGAQEFLLLGRAASVEQRSWEPQGSWPTCSAHRFKVLQWVVNNLKMEGKHENQARFSPFPGESGDLATLDSCSPTCKVGSLVMGLLDTSRLCQ